MEKNFIPYEESVALEALGFNEPCFAGYSILTEKIEFYSKPLLTRDSFTVDAPIYSQAFRWFKKEYGIFVSIVPNKYGSLDSFIGWIYIPLNGSTKDIDVGGRKGYNTPEETELACLRKLIEIVKNNE